jgi:hypothetical protein
VQYGYKPAYNTTTLRVLAGSTEIVTTIMGGRNPKEKHKPKGRCIHKNYLTIRHCGIRRR